MNKKRRERIRYAAGLLEQASSIVDNCRDEENDAMSNLEGTSLENTDRYSEMEEACDYLDDAFDEIESARDKLFSAIG